MGNIPIRHIKEVLNEPKLLGSFIIRDIDEMLGGKDMVQELHRHDFFFILLLEKGSGCHEIDFIKYEIGDYSVFLMRPGQVHELTLNVGSTGFLVQFETDFFYSENIQSHKILRKVSHINFCKVTNDGFDKLRAILAYIFKEHTEKFEGYQEVIKSNLGIFFIELLRHRQNKVVPQNDGSQYSQEKLEKFLELLEVNIAHKKQVSEYAEMLHFSTYQLSAITKTLLDKTPSEIINDYIILEAKRHLLATSLQVNQIAWQLGYEDASYFTRFFKKHTGSSPETFRLNFK